MYQDLQNYPRVYRIVFIQHAKIRFNVKFTSHNLETVPQNIAQKIIPRIYDDRRIFVSWLRATFLLPIRTAERSGRSAIPRPSTEDEVLTQGGERQIASRARTKENARTTFVKM